MLQVCRHYNQGDVARLRHQLMTLPGEVDLLLTCEWPAGILQHLPAGQDNLPGKPWRLRCPVLCCAGVGWGAELHLAGTVVARCVM
jgi:hypothetical protein